jgi:thioredoxin reductase
VEIRLGVEADAASVLAESPDVVAIATGARALRPDVPGLAQTGRDAWDVLTGPDVAGRRVLVIDEEYGFQAPSAAEYLLDRAHEVHIVTSERTIGSFLGATTGPPIFRRLFSKGVMLHANLCVTRIESDRAVARNVWSDREESLGPYDVFVYAFGGVSVCGLETDLAGRAPRVELIGDSFAPRTLQHAILEGHRLARDL